MIFDTEWRRRRIEVKIAGLTAKLKATREIFNACAGTVPGGIVIDMRDIPQRIAELETRAKQLVAPNV